MTTANEFLETSLRPVLQEMAVADPRFYTPEAEKLMLMIACHESQGFQYIRQKRGPALSYYQIEPATLHDLLLNYLEKHGRDKLGLLREYEVTGISFEDNLVQPDQFFATCAARLQLWRFRASIPKEDDFDSAWDHEVALAEYAKRYWNTAAGKATAHKYLDDYLRYKPPGYGE